MIIRIATIDDIPNLLPLMSQLGYPVNGKELERRFNEFTSLDGYGVAVACEQTQLIGWVAWSKSKPFVVDKTRIHLEGLVVAEQQRGKGIGKKLMNFMEEAVKAYRPVIIDLISGVRRAKDGSHEFYKSLGYHNDGPMAKLYFRKEME